MEGCIPVSSAISTEREQLDKFINVLNKQQLCKLTLQRMLLIMVILGAFGAKNFEYCSWYIASYPGSQWVGKERAWYTLRMHLISPKYGNSGVFSDSSLYVTSEFELDSVYLSGY